jgi:hypothetical protein
MVVQRPVVRLAQEFHLRPSVLIVLEVEENGKLQIVGTDLVVLGDVVE